MSTGGGPRVALVGASGHGLSHRRTLHRLAAQGLVEPVALCDVRPVDEPGGLPVFTDHRAMLAAARPDIVIICTPPHTHLPIALDAVAAGADLLLEKPPVADLTEHETLAAALAEHGQVCQVGYQALGSAALGELAAALRDRPPAGSAAPDGQLAGSAALDGRLAGAALGGPLARVAALGAWWRPGAYWRRSPWAGRARLDGRFVADGALANPFAHATMQAVALAEAVTGWPRGAVRVELERYRCRDIEVDDTSCLRLTDETGMAVQVSVTLCSAVFVAGEIRAGAAALEYPTDRLRLPGDDGWRRPSARTGLLENLVEHRRDGVPLVAPLARTRMGTALLEVMAAAPAPTPIPTTYLAAHPDGDGMVIPDIDRTLDDAARRGTLLSELGVQWAVPAHRAVIENQGARRCAR